MDKRLSPRPENQKVGVFLDLVNDRLEHLEGHCPNRSFHEFGTGRTCETLEVALICGLNLDDDRKSQPKPRPEFHKNSLTKKVEPFAKRQIAIGEGQLVEAQPETPFCKKRDSGQQPIAQ